MSDASTEAMPHNDSRETRQFQAEVSRVLHLVIHSLYSHKEVFLRELVSNAADALDRLRFRAVTEPDLLRDDARTEIRIAADPAQGTLTVEDTGVGMTRDELAENLGTIAHSGSRAFLEALAKQGGKPGLDLIGQFGVGFYAAFLVADRVEVVSRPASGGPAHRWVSDGRDSFTLEPADRADRGTAVTLHLQQDQRGFLDEWRLRELIARYSDYVSHPIQLRVTPRPAKPGEPAPEPRFETVNRASALWRRPKNEITDESYDDLYRHLTHDPEAPLARTHFRVEGTQEFVGLLYVPRHPPFDYELQTGPRRGVRLFVRRVFVMDDCTELLPEWLRFVRGVIDSDDLPLNVSRETLQDSQVVRAIRKQVTRKTLDLLEDLAQNRPADYATFWGAFGTSLKAGVHVDFEHRERLIKLLRYATSHESGLTSLADYVARMPEGQPAIYYAFGDSRAALESSPHLEAVRKRGYEVLFMTDPVDEWATESIGEFEKKKLASVMRAELPLPATEEPEDEKRAREERESELKPLLDKVRAVLQERVQEVRLSERLTDSPACLVIPRGSHHAAVERLLRAHGQKLAPAKRVFELNGSHPLVKALAARLARDPSSPQLVEWIELLHDQALLTEGSAIDDPQRFARRLTALLEAAAHAAPEGPRSDG